MTSYIKQEETNNVLAAILKGDDPANLWSESDFIAIQSEEDKDATSTAWIDQGKRCATARNVSWSAFQRAYSIWKKRGLVRLTACKTVQDFEGARAFLTACEAENVAPPFTLAMVIDAEKAAGIIVDPETPRRIELLEKQEKTWNNIAEGMCGGWGVTLSTYGYMGLKPSRATPKPTYFLAKDIIYLGKARDYRDGSWNYVFEFRDGSGVWKTKLIPAKLFGMGRGNEWLADLKEAGAIIGDGGLFAQIINAAEAPKVIRLATKTGWQNERATVYAMPSGEIIGAKDETLPTFKPMNKCGRRGTKQDADEQVMKYAVGNSRLIGGVTLALAAPFARPMNIHPGIIHFYGLSGDGKSTAQKVALTVYASSDTLMSWRMTDNGFEGVASQLDDGTLIAEDLKQAPGAKAVWNSVMGLGNGKGKVAMTQKREVRDVVQYHTMMLSTGESSLKNYITAARIPGASYDGGVASRCADIPSDAGGEHRLFENLHGFTGGYDLAIHLEAATAKHYGHYLPMLLEAYAADPEAFLKELADNMQRAFELFGRDDASENVTRPRDRFALMAAVGEAAIARGILPWPKGEALRGVTKLVTDWRVARCGKEKAGATEALAALEEFGRTLSVHGSRIQKVTAGGDERDVSQRLGFQRIGEDGATVIYMDKSQLEEAVGNPERVLPFLKYLRDGKSENYRLRISRQGAFTYQTPRSLVGALRTKCYAIEIVAATEENQKSEFL